MCNFSHKSLYVTLRKKLRKNEDFLNLEIPAMEAIEITKPPMSGTVAPKLLRTTGQEDLIKK